MVAVRAALLQEILHASAALGREAAERVVAGASPAALHRIAHATRVDWLPVELNVELARAGLATVGEAGLKAWGRAAFRRAVEASLLRPILEGAMRLFGPSPGAVLRTAPAAFQAAYRGAGVLGVSGVEDRACSLTLRAVPRVLQDRAWLLALAGAMEGVFDACEVAGEVDLVSPESGDRVVFEARWAPAAGPAADPDPE